LPPRWRKSIPPPPALHIAPIQYQAIWGVNRRHLFGDQLASISAS
jgi:hypothetical protein